MNAVQHARKEITDLIESACANLPRAEYREVLNEIASYVEIALEALDEDDERDKRGDGT